jgi:hypothetical protein
VRRKGSDFQRRGLGKSKNDAFGVKEFRIAPTRKRTIIKKTALTVLMILFVTVLLTPSAFSQTRRIAIGTADGGATYYPMGGEHRHAHLQEGAWF